MYTAARFAVCVSNETKIEGAELMISNQILQNTIDGLKGITRIDLCIIDVEGKVRSEERRVGKECG